MLSVCRYVPSTIPQVVRIMAEKEISPAAICRCHEDPMASRFTRTDFILVEKAVSCDIIVSPIGNDIKKKKELRDVVVGSEAPQAGSKTYIPNDKSTSVR